MKFVVHILAFVILNAVCVSQVTAESRREWPAYDGSRPAWVEIHDAPEDSTAYAQVTFFNRVAHQGSEEFTLTFGEFDVLIILSWQYDGGQAEMITVIPPPGYIAIPPEIVVDEDTTGTVLIYGATS